MAVKNKYGYGVIDRKTDHFKCQNFRDMLLRSCNDKIALRTVHGLQEASAAMDLRISALAIHHRNTSLR